MLHSLVTTLFLLLFGTILLLCLQLYLLTERIEDAVTDFEKSLELSPHFAVAQVQKCYTGKYCYTCYTGNLVMLHG